MKVEEANKMNVQEMLDFMIDKIVGQGKQCMNDGECSYGDGAGNHCAVGWVLNEEIEVFMDYDGDVMGLLDETVALRMQGDMPIAVIEHPRLFCAMQSLHDSTRLSDRARFLEALKRHHPQYNYDNPNWMKWVEMGEA